MKHKFLPVEQQLEQIKDSVEPVEIIDEQELARRLEKSIKDNRPLRIKQGFDASAPDLHLGHAVSLWKLKTFQDLGHRVIFLIGDFTAMIGDPSGKTKTRPRLTREQVLKNSETYREQVSRILDPAKIEIRFNSEWHAKRNIYEFLELTSNFTVRRMLERDDFWKRFWEELPISIMEFLYPLIQAYDSVALEADLEMGGTDQKFNLLLARQIQRAYDQEPQVVMLMPLMRGTEGTLKMSKSLGNSIGLFDPPEEIYGKVLSIPDDLIEEYITYGSGASKKEIPALIKLAESDPYELKHHVAGRIVNRYYADADPDQLKQNFLAMFKHGEEPTHKDMLESGSEVHIHPDVNFLPRIMVIAGAASSNSEAMRLIKGNGVSINGEKVPFGDLEVSEKTPYTLKVGKRRFYLIYNHKDQLSRL